MRYFCGMTTDLNTDWKDLMVQLVARFGEALELDGILFLIGLQELGKGYQRFNKDQKMDVLYIAMHPIGAVWLLPIYRTRCCGLAPLGAQPKITSAKRRGAGKANEGGYCRLFPNKVSS